MKKIIAHILALVMVLALCAAAVLPSMVIVFAILRIPPDIFAASPVLHALTYR